MSTPALVEESSEQFLLGGGEMGQLIRTMDWSKTALGPISTWPQSLRTSVSLCLSSTFPILIAWGPEKIQIYNDSYRPICGAKHPESMGQNFRICWETALPVVGDKFTRGEQGEGTYIKDQRMFLDRYGYLEEAFMTFSFAPIRDESGGVGGIFHPITETTEKMLSARRTQVLRDLGAAIGKAKSVQEIGEMTLAQYDAYQLDVPFMLFYEVDGTSERDVDAEVPVRLVTVAGANYLIDRPWPFQQAMDHKDVLEFSMTSDGFRTIEAGPYEEPPHTAMMLPLRLSGQTEVYGFIVAGVSARRALDEEYRNFYDQLTATYNTAISNVYAYEQEQKRAEALAAIDRSKTLFFSNVSHEFRTPLTLMLGPLEELLQQHGLDGHTRVQVEATHRNALRLLKLVNNLLDYSRVEAGRVQAVYQRLDLQEMTIDLASSFRSIIEKAGMELNVHCSPLSASYYADRQMWEKIVLNLLSNAFKYTLQGSISVTLEEQENMAVLKVKDTGVGIPQKELPHMFERFHRIENTAGRTHEGTGIGLSLVHELVHLHAGTITVESIEGTGSTFTVCIPVGKEHLPVQQVIEDKKDIDTEAIKGAFIREAYSLLQEDSSGPTGSVNKTTGDISGHQDHSADKATRILIVDDNHDMRDYLVRLLNPYFTIDTALNGQDALLKIGAQMPDLVLSDVMMPVMDGKAMLERIRSNENTLRLPVIFLSARAGEEARIDGLEMGADDYLVKPFSAAELLTKVRAQIHISKSRGYAEQQLRNLLKQAPVAMVIYRGPRHVIELANSRMLDYWGRTEEETFGKPLFEAIPELASPEYRNMMARVYETGEPFISDEVPLMLNRFGKRETGFINLTVEALRELEGQVSGLIAVAADVTEQVNARTSLEKINNTLQLAMEASNMGTWQTDLKTGLLQISETSRHIHGIPEREQLVYSEILKELVVPEHVDRLGKAIENAVSTKGRFSEDYQIQPLTGGGRKWINTTGMVELDESGEPSTVIGTILDITESKEDEIRKNDFIGMVSHELKTPLTSLVGFTQLGLRNAQKNQDSLNFSIYEKTNRQLIKMSSLINGFLNVSQLESGKIHLHLTDFRLDELIREMIADAGLAASGYDFQVDCVELIINADRNKIGTVLTNLLSNAIKYGANSRVISIACSCTDGYARVSVTDQGIGIKEADISKLFDRYYRIENNQTQHISGFGIGLYLSAEIIGRHHGKIWAESEPGKGTTLFVELPMMQISEI
ncbi:ATP-binding protein [Pedobacter sp. BAL39]|uniref:ATP-binding protein n=1 Tax=Pedobacter sp. BAL39 TaxID=391596 RepID=UPI000310972E|nr:ATP-binding protein [Pedobacter sp. BAL39]